LDVNDHPRQRTGFIYRLTYFWTQTEGTNLRCVPDDPLDDFKRNPAATGLKDCMKRPAK
jgi:hypothetical protein